VHFVWENRQSMLGHEKGLWVGPLGGFWGSKMEVKANKVIITIIIIEDAHGAITAAP